MMGCRLHHPSHRSSDKSPAPCNEKARVRPHPASAAEEKRRTCAHTARYEPVLCRHGRLRNGARLFVSSSNFDFAALTGSSSHQPSNDPAFGLRQVDADTLRDDWRMRLHRKMAPGSSSKAGSTQGRNQGTLSAWMFFRSMSQAPTLARTSRGRCRVTRP